MCNLEFGRIQRVSTFGAVVDLAAEARTGAQQTLSLSDPVSILYSLPKVLLSFRVAKCPEEPRSSIVTSDVEGSFGKASTL